MRKQKLKQLFKLLNEKQEELTQTYYRAQSKTTAPSDGTEDYVDYAVNSYTKEFLLSLSDMDRKLLKQVEEALKKMNNKVFGICEQCSEPISEKRLEAVPWARHCLECQEKEEKSLSHDLSTR